MKAQVSIVRCPDYEKTRVQEAVRRAVDLVGGMKSFIKAGSTVLVKPNLLMAIEPRFAVDTHPEVVRAVIILLKECGARILLGDGPSVWGAASSEVGKVYDVSGIKAIAEEEGVELVTLEKRRWFGEVLLSTWVDDCDFIVNVPKFKTHNYTVISGAIKNLFGLVPDKYKLELHKNFFEPERFAGMLVDIYEAARPALNVVDGIVALQGDGPGTSGVPQDMGLVLAGQDAVAVDSVIAGIMGLKPFDVPMIKQATERGLGKSAAQDIDILGEKLDSVSGRPYQLPHSAFFLKTPSILPKAILKGLIRFRPCIDREKCVLCRTCIKTCPEEAVKLLNDKIRIDYSKCISCFCCQESCPHKAIDVKKGILAKLLRL
jgi:uncharacterized protein (DUF362 family)/Pyruvate/2-oxoacid:ferredoxin oxidoreductase delta subunit